MAAELSSIVATGAQQFFILSSVNDPATSVPPLFGSPNTVNNYETVAAGIKASLPNAKIHVVSNIFWGGATAISELVPDSSNTESAVVINLNNYIKSWVPAHPDFVEYLDLRAFVLAYEIANNTGNVPNGFLTQSTSGTHITPLGQTVWSQGVWNLITVAR